MAQGRRNLEDQFSGKGKNIRPGKVHTYSEAELAEFQAKLDAEKAAQNNSSQTTSTVKPVTP